MPRLCPLFPLVALLFVFSAPAKAADISEVPGWATAFEAAGVEGTFALLDPADGHILVHDATRAQTRFLPASTFKILNSLIALQTGASTGPDMVLRWDGTDRGLAAWNKDLTMREAFAVSAIWYYQELARRAGPAAMADWVRRADYGNFDIGGNSDSFWLDGALRISALEQVDFLRRLAEERLPFDPANMNAVREMMVVERTPDYTLCAKSGWATRVTPQIAWWVGWVERGGRRVYFALNLTVNAPKDAAAREGVARAILKEQGLI